MGLGIDRPKVLGATHFHEIFENGFLQPRASLTYGYMEVCLDQEAEHLEDQVTYLYKYELQCYVNPLLIMQIAFEPAVVTQVMVAGEDLPSLLDSRANRDSSCAALNGIDATIVDRANHLMEMSIKGEDLVSACAEFSEKEEDDLRDAVNDFDCIGIKIQY